MNEDEAKRLRRIIYALVVIVLFFIAGVTTWASVELGRMKQLIAAIHISQPTNGVDGKNGYTPIKGIDYFDGTNGVNGSAGADGSPGLKGDKGDTGDRGITIVTSPTECIVTGDTDPQPISECQ